MFRQRSAEDQSFRLGLNRISPARSSTIVFAPFTSAQTSPNPLLANFLQGIKVNPYQPNAKGNSFLMTGTTGSAISAGGTGAIYIGAIDGLSTPAGSGSGTWINFSVPFDGAIETSCYGPDILSRGQGPGNIGRVSLVGTWINANKQLLGWTYNGKLSSLSDKSPNKDSRNFKSFQATTADDKPANYTYLHSVDDGYVVGNYTTLGGPIGLGLNSGPGAGSFVYNPKTQTQKNAVYNNKNYNYHSLFGIWHNPSGTYTVAGGGSTQGMANSFDKLVNIHPDLQSSLPKDAAFGRGMFADLDPVTGKVRGERYYNYDNKQGSDTLTHFQGIYYAGNRIYEAPFDAVLSTGQALVGIAYVKRLANGSFSRNALWQVFPEQTTGSLLSNDSVAASGSVGAFNNGTATSFASLSDTQAYLFAAQSLT